jgi:hypothetical protein
MRLRRDKLKIRIRRATSLGVKKRRSDHVLLEDLSQHGRGREVHIYGK